MTRMAKAAILIDGGYFLTRLPVVRPDVDTAHAKAVADSVGQLVHSHLRQLNEALQAPNPASLLYRSFYYDARPYDQKGHTTQISFLLRSSRDAKGCSSFSIRSGSMSLEICLNTSMA